MVCVWIWVWAWVYVCVIDSINLLYLNTVQQHRVYIYFAQTIWFSWKVFQCKLNFNIVWLRKKELCELTDSPMNTSYHIISHYISIFSPFHGAGLVFFQTKIFWSIIMERTAVCVRIVFVAVDVVVYLMNGVAEW